MISKNNINRLRQLHQKKYREETSLFPVEGNKSVIELVQSGWTVKELYATPEWIDDHRNIIPVDVEPVAVSLKEMERISAWKAPQEVLAVALNEALDLKSIDPENVLWILDGIRDPGNLGTIIRTADWFGYKQILCSPDTVELTNPKTIQATMGSFTRVKVYYAPLHDYLATLGEGIPVYGTFMEGTPLQEIKFRNTDRIIIGNEAHGISGDLIRYITRKITIPNPLAGYRQTESLNAAIAAAIIMYQSLN